LAIRVTRFVLLLVVSWVVMTFTHELGHIIGGTCCGGTLKSAELRPWRLPYSIFEPDPFPLVTLWAGLILGVLVPVGTAIALQREWMWFIANFCVLANGAYIATAWFAGDRFLDTPKLLEHGASPITIAAYCILTLGCGYVGFRRSCIAALTVPTTPNTGE
jgi:uncharacterized membrane protein YoaK (UPF0700 family)